MTTKVGNYLTLEASGLGIFVLSTIWFTWRARNPPQIPYQQYAAVDDK